MITRCRHGDGQIRDCTAFDQQGHFTIGWYHTETGHEMCNDQATVAQPLPFVAVSCPQTPHDQQLCQTVADVSAWYHEQGRCIPALCRYPHA